MRDGLLQRRTILRSLLLGGTAVASGVLSLQHAVGQTLGQPPPPRGRGTTSHHCPRSRAWRHRSGRYRLERRLRKDLALDAARLVAQQLDATRRYRVVLTRTSDEFVPLPDRVARARAADGDLSYRSMPMRCPIRECAAPRSSPSRKRLPTPRRQRLPRARQGRFDRRHRSLAPCAEVSSILIDLARRQTNNQSIQLARRLVDDLGRDVTMLNNSHRSAGFAVLKAPRYPVGAG